MTDDQGTELVRGLIGRGFATLLDDVRRARSLLGDAGPKLAATFQSLQSRVRDHVKLINTLSSALGGEAGTSSAGLVGGMQVIIDTFVSDLVAVSQQSMRIVERVTLMSEEVNSINKTAARVEEMANSTRFVALNAQIEANRTRAGEVFKVVADETKQLAVEADHFSAEIRNAVDRCQSRLTETQSIVAALASHDMTVALRAQTNLTDTMKTLESANGELLVTLTVLDEQVNAAMTALQFDDILSQLLAGVEKRIGLLEEVWLDSLPISLEPDQTRHMVLAWERRKAELERQQAVHQDSLETGTAELF